MPSEFTIHGSPYLRWRLCRLQMPCEVGRVGTRARDAESGKTYLRYAKAIAIQPMCLACHGSGTDIPDGVKARLQSEYPADKATGYSVGELRGAVVVMRPL